VSDENITRELSLIGKIKVIKDFSNKDIFQSKKILGALST
jgi:hypothetical protein